MVRCVAHHLLHSPSSYQHNFKGSPHPEGEFSLVYTIGSLCAFFSYLISSHQVVLFASTLGHIDLPELQALQMQSRVIVLYWVLLEPWFSVIQ